MPKPAPGAFPLKITDVVRAGGTHLTWTSRPEDTCTIWSSPDPSKKKSWIQDESVPSGGEMTTWSDPGTTSARKFYRIEVE